jgi:hypothetical protein
MWLGIRKYGKAKRPLGNISVDWRLRIGVRTGCYKEGEELWALQNAWNFFTNSGATIVQKGLF